MKINLKKESKITLLIAGLYIIIFSTTNIYALTLVEPPKEATLKKIEPGVKLKVENKNNKKNPSLNSNDKNFPEDNAE